LIETCEHSENINEGIYVNYTNCSYFDPMFFKTETQLEMMCFEDIAE